VKFIDYDQLCSKFKPKGAISVDANIIANMLIREHCLQQGNNLAQFLKVEPFFDNYMALRVWVQRRLKAQDDYIIDEMHNQLQIELYTLLPQSYSY
jgi:hypothetical protein